MRARHHSGFTLIELMIVVAIIGILASVAMPSFLRNARKTKTAEATLMVSKMYGNSRTYIMEALMARNSIAPIPPQFPEPAPQTPAVTCCVSPGRKCAPNPILWNSDSWAALRFEMTDPHYYLYTYESTGGGVVGAGSEFTARANGDLDCDGIYSTFEMVGELSSLDFDVHGSAGIFNNLPIE